MLEASDGNIWVSTTRGLSEFEGGRFHSYTASHGLSSDIITALLEDSDGSLWVGTRTSGAMRLANSGLVVYRKEDGLRSEWVYSIFENRSGELCVISADGYIHRMAGGRFSSVRFDVLNPGTGRQTLQDHEGEWWFGSRQGLYRFPRVKKFEELNTVRPKALYTTRDGLADNDVRQIYEDSRGDLWINSFAPNGRC